ncbi:uncharacterized protein At4g02000-like [Quercus suber]|uniref:uncharacterized protein At4g02000-like n=1 Tax=Quercus suber TaxID=58331 RepID=UPI0032E01E21
MEELAQWCENLRLSQKEGGELDIDPEAAEAGLVMVEKFLTKRRINLEAVVHALNPIWKTTENFEVEDDGDNTALLVFRNEEDLDRVPWPSPWTFNKYLLVLHKLGLRESVSSLPFDRAPFWVQIHGLPMRQQTKTTGEHLGGSLGEVVMVDVRGQGFSMGKFLQVRVDINIFEPLCRGRMVRMGGPMPVWVDFRYERLSIFCYWCGKLDHDDRDFPLWIQSKESLGLEDKQFGLWLQAKPKRLQ